MNPEEKNAFLIVVAAMPVLAWRTFVAFLRLRRTAKRSERSLYRTLVTQGIPRGQAKDLAYNYIEFTTLKFWIRNMLSPSRFK